MKAPEMTDSNFRANHLPYSSVDLDLLKGHAERWAQHGHKSSLSLETASQGFITITAKNWLDEFSAPFIRFEIHKIRGKKLLFWQTRIWAVQVLTAQNGSGVFPVVHGCIPQMQIFVHILDDILSRRWGGFAGQEPKPLVAFYG